MALFKKPSGILSIALISLFALVNSNVMAQNEVAIGSTTTKSNAILWLNGNGSQGLILPVVTSKSAVSNPDKGMIVFDDSDNKVWYRSNSAWVEVGSGGSGGSNDNLNLSIQGNQLLLRDGTTVLSSIAVASGTQITDAFMVFQNGAWQFASINDISRSGGNLQVTGIRGKSVASLPNTTQALVYDPSATSGNGGWTFQPLSGASGVTSVSGTAPVTVTNPTTTPTISLANGGITNTLLADNAVNSAKVQDGTLIGADIANGSITADKLGQSGATNNQVLQWNGTTWVPATLASSGTVTQIITGTGLTGGPITTTGTISIAANGVGTTQLADNSVTTAKINTASVDNTKLADNAVNSAKISDGTITGADIATTTITTDKLAASGASNGQVLKWNGTNWVPQADNTGTVLPALATGQLLTNNGTNDVAVTMSGDATFTGTGALTIANNAVTTIKLADNSVTSAKIVNATVTGVDIAATTITGANIAATTITADKLAQSGAANNQVLQWNGTNWVPASQNFLGSTLNSTQLFVGNASNVATAVTMSGDASISNTGALTIANNAINSAKISDGSITGTDIAATTITGSNIAGTTITADKLAASGASNGQVLKWNGTNWVPQDDNGGAALPVLAAGQLVTNDGTNDIAVTMSGDATFTGTGALTIANNAVTTTKLADNSVTSAKIVNATVTGADIAATTITGSNIAGTTITADKLAQSGAANNQVLQWNGTNWVPASQNFLGSTLNSTQLFVGNASNVATAVTMSGDATISNTGALTIANNAITTVKIANTAVDATKLADNAVTTTKINAGAVDNTKLTDNSVTSVKIADGTITSSDLSTLGAVSPGQILQWNGTSWSAVILPATPIDVTTQTGVLVGDGTTITGTNAGAGVRGILGSSNSTIGWVTGTPNQILGTNASGDLQFADQSAFVSSTLNSSQILVGNASNTATAVTMSGDATLSNTGALTIANNAINSAKISDGSITGTDIAATTITGNNIFALTITADKLAQSGATNDQVLQWNGTNWVPTSLVADFSTLNIIPKGNGSGLVASQIFDNGTNMGIGTVTPAAKLDIIGTIKITDGTQAAGSVLTSDANGLASWQPAGAGSGWTLLGNGSTVDGTNFIGTTNNIPFSIRVNNVRSGRIETTTGENTFFGYRSGLVNAGTRNTGMGVNSLDSNDGGSNNTAFGYNAMQANTDGIENTAFGYNALTNNTTANLNTAFGKSALYTQNAAVTNTNNTAVGYHALYFNNPTTTNDGKNNVALGYFAGEANTTGRDNTFIGASAQPSSGTLNNATAIGSGAVVDRSNTMIFGNGTVEGWGFGGAQPASCCDAIIVGTNTNNGNGATLSKFGDWTSTSDGTKKYNINPLEYGLKEIMLLKPVNYQWKGNDEVDFGFIAQEVKTILPEIVHGEEGHMTLSYGRVTAVLTKAIQEQQDQIEALKAQLKDKDDKVLNLESSVNSMKEELETIKRALGMEATAKSSSKNK